MPTREELPSLYQKGMGHLNIDPAFKTSGFFVWSSESEDSSSAWCFAFNIGRGYVENSIDACDFRAFAVRSRT